MPHGSLICGLNKARYFRGKGEPTHLLLGHPEIMSQEKEKGICGEKFMLGQLLCT